MVRALTPIRDRVEKRALLPELRNVFLCHAWDDRQGAAKELRDLLASRGVRVWFSEKDIALGTPLTGRQEEAVAFVASDSVDTKLRGRALSCPPVSTIG